MEPEFLSPQKDVLSSFFPLKDGKIPGNKGLIFDRYLDIWGKGRSGEGWQKIQDIYPRLKVFAERLQAVDTALLRDIHSRQQLIIKDSGQIEMGESTFTVAWRLACGLGYDHPLENGFSIDYTTGIPYIPASSIKGLCRAMAGYYSREDRIKEQWDTSEQLALFGGEDTDNRDRQAEKQLGDIVFLDAYPYPEKPLVVTPNIVNTHHQAYYHSHLYITGEQSGDGTKTSSVARPETGAPMETENPVPVFFLTIGAGSRFVFRFFSRTRNQANMKKIAMALEEGLSFLGIGAKTAAGYGQLVRDGDGDSEKNGDSISPTNSEASAWVDKNIEALSKKHNEPKLRNVLIGRPLAAAWQQVDDDALKQDITRELHHRWEAGNIGPNKKAQEIYPPVVRE